MLPLKSSLLTTCSFTTMDSRQMKILIVDDHRLFCEGLRHILANLGDNIDILEADRCESAISLVKDHPDLSLVMLDITMPGMDGCAGLNWLSQHYPALPVVMLTASESGRDMRRSFDSGASGYIPKSSSADVMLGALKLVLAGGIYVPPSLAGIHASQSLQGACPAANDETNARSDGLTERQKEVLSYLQKGLSNREIAGRMALSEATVKVHLSAIFRTLGVHSRTEAVVRAGRLMGNN